MNNKAWIARKALFALGVNKERRHIIAGIKKGLACNQLSAITYATLRLRHNLSQAPVVVARLNSLFDQSPIQFQWFPENHSGKLLIRNYFIGLIISPEPGCAPKGMQIIFNADGPYCAISPEAALTQLSRISIGKLL